MTTILRSPFTLVWITAFAAIAITAPDRGPAKGLDGRLFMGFWCASCLTLAAIHLFKPSAARGVLDAVFTLQDKLSLFGRERDAYAMSNFAVRCCGIGLLAIASLGIRDIFFN